MSKDPAFLFYSADFIVGVQTLNFEERGKYITLLCQMHQQGRMTEEDISLLIGSIPDTLKSKFLIDENGLWYNKRLEYEVQKRNRFCESRRASRLYKNKSISKIRTSNVRETYVERMENENDNININKDLSSSLGKTENPFLEKTWRTDYQTYLDIVEAAYLKVRNSPDIISEQERFHPGVDIMLSLEKAFKNFWGTEAGWKHKKKSRTKEIDMISTFINAIGLNKVFKPRDYNSDNRTGENSDEAILKKLMQIK
jgi:uncharacterized protein YdaU (DUF1376 family)